MIIDRNTLLSYTYDDQAEQANKPSFRKLFSRRRPVACDHCGKEMKEEIVDLLHFAEQLPEMLSTPPCKVYETSDGRTYLWSGATNVMESSSNTGTYLLRQRWRACHECRRAFIAEGLVREQIDITGAITYESGRQIAETRAKSVLLRQRLASKKIVFKKKGNTGKVRSNKTTPYQQEDCSQDKEKSTRRQQPNIEENLIVQRIGVSFVIGAILITILVVHLVRSCSKSNEDSTTSGNVEKIAP